MARTNHIINERIRYILQLAILHFIPRTTRPACDQHTESHVGGGGADESAR